MVKVIKNNSPYPRKLICEKCGSELEYDESDLEIREYGCAHVQCPACNFYNMLEDNEHSITLTEDNIQFPEHFHHVVYTGNEDVANICNNENVREYIKTAVNFLRYHPEEEYIGGHVTGNMYVLVLKNEEDGEFNITVSKDFYTMEIPI